MENGGDFFVAVDRPSLAQLVIGFQGAARITDFQAV